MAFKPRRRDPGKCSRCHKNPVQRPSRICQACIKAPKKRRTGRATSRPASGHAGAVLQRSAATAAPTASEAFYRTQPTPAACQHPPTRQFAWHAYDGALCVGCCDCGAVLAGAAESAAVEA